MKKEEALPKNRYTGKYYTRQPILFVIFGIVLLIGLFSSTIYYSGQFLSFQALPGTSTIPLFMVTTILTVLAFLITHILLFVFVYKFRSRSGHIATPIRGNLKLELMWTIFPALMFITLFLWSQSLWNEIKKTAVEDKLVIEVMAEQFNWNTRYGGVDQKLGRSAFRFISDENAMGIDRSDPNSEDDFIPLQMHIPKNQTVTLLLHSKDVIHSFYIPSFGTKMDAVPGMTTSMHFKALYSTDEMRKKLNDNEFNYEVACAELCGKMHFAMKLILIVDEREQFDTWYASQRNASIALQ